jgi:hypothetical protein
MSIQTFRKALCQLPLSQEERASLTKDELFVLVLARRLDRLTDAEQQRLKAADRQHLASAGLISSEVPQTEANITKAPTPCRGCERLSAHNSR